jgi:hypothetical protein
MPRSLARVPLGLSNLIATFHSIPVVRSQAPSRLPCCPWLAWFSIDHRVNGPLLLKCNRAMKPLKNVAHQALAKGVNSSIEIAFCLGLFGLLQ